jgi:hypothetical protein
MIEGVIHSIVLNARAKTGVTGEFLAWTLAGAVFSVIAVMFFSVGAYVWLAGLYGGAVAGLVVGGVHLAIAIIVFVRCVAVRRDNKQLARTQIDLATKHPGWPIDPSYVAMGVEIVKIIGVRNLVPLVAAGVLAAGWSASRAKAHAAGRPQ